MDWMGWLRFAGEVVIVSLTAGIAVWRAVVSGLDSKIQGMEGRLSVRLDSLDVDLENIEGKMDQFDQRLRKNTEQIAVLRDRWEREWSDGGGGS